MRTIQAPGIEVKEIDVSQYNSLFNNYLDTSVLAFGFADKGEDLAPKYILSLKDFIDTYGYPTNEAERYFYNTAKEIFDKEAIMIAAKLPYKNTSLSNFTFTTYKVETSTEIGISNDIRNCSTISAELAGKLIGTIGTYDKSDGPTKSGLMSLDIFDKKLVGETKVENNCFEIVDITRGRYFEDKIIKAKTNQSTECIGIVPVIVSPLNALYFQDIITDVANSNHYNLINALNNVYSGLENTELDERCKSGENFDIKFRSNDKYENTIGKIATSYFPKFRFRGKVIDNKYLNQIGIVVFRIVVNAANESKLSFVPIESFVGSFDRNAKDEITNKSIFIDNVVNESSSTIRLFSNISNAEKIVSYYIGNQIIKTLGFYKGDCNKTIDPDLILNSLKNIFVHLKDPNYINIDLVVDGGISNIASYISNISDESKRYYIPEYDISLTTKIITEENILAWRKVIDLYKNFCEVQRKDCMFLGDGPRDLGLTGNFKVVRKTRPENTIEKNILPYLKYINGFNTSYGAGDLIWFKCLDDTTRSYMWMPPSLKQLKACLNCDRNFFAWEAPAGIKRGKVDDAYDISFNPSMEEAGRIYINNWNYAFSYPLDGITIEGQKTFQIDATAFDRINVRRLFLRMERDIRRIARTFVYEGITDMMLLRFRDAVEKYMTSVQNNGGVIEFQVICDDRNNTNETKDNNEVHIAIGAKPVKSAEFIIMNFICTNQGANVQEITTQYM